MAAGSAPRARLALALLPPLLAAGWLWPGSAASRSAAAPALTLPTGMRSIATLPLASLARSTPASARPAAAEIGSVQGGAAGWSITPGDASRAELAQQLADQSGSRVVGDLAALASQPVMRQAAQGLDLQAAWRLLLGSGVNYALRCSSAHCTVWLIGGSAAPRPDADDANPQATRLPPNPNESGSPA